jgi:phosphatidylinositol alpha-1,6-mannosyltransferase
MTARPRLLILTPDYPPAPGGIQLVSERLAAGLGGFQTQVLTLSAPGAAEFDRTRAAAVRRVGAGALPLPHAARLATLNAAAVREALRFRPSLTLSMHIVLSPAAAAVKRALGVPFVQYFHAEEIGARPRLAAFAAQQAKGSIAVSGYTAGLLRAAGAMDASIRVVPNGVDVPAAGADPVVPAAQAGEEPIDRPTFVTVARIQERYKGHDVLVRALALVRAKVPRVQWALVGDGSLRAGIEALARSYGVADSIRFLGAVSDEERDLWLRRAQLLAMPSRLPSGGFAGEGFGIVYLEAGAHGKPVVAGNVGGALDAVLDGVTGLLVDPLDELAVAEAITTLLLDPELARRLGVNGRRRAEEHAWPLIVERLQAILLGLLA